MVPLVDDCMEADLNESLQLTIRKGWGLGRPNDWRRFTGTPAKNQQYFGGKGYDRVSQETILRNSVRKQERSISVLKSIIARLVIQTTVCFAFSRATEDITTKYYISGKNFFRGLNHFCISPSVHIWLLQREAQLGPRCVW